MYLLDTNIFLEILLRQEKEQVCKNFLNDNIGSFHISDFSLHSIGVILFREQEVELFNKFLSDTLPNVSLISLPETEYSEIIKIKKK